MSIMYACFTIEKLAMIRDRGEMQAALAHLPQRILRTARTIGIAGMVMEIAVKELKPLGLEQARQRQSLRYRIDHQLVVMRPRIFTMRHTTTL